LHVVGLLPWSGHCKCNNGRSREFIRPTAGTGAPIHATKRHSPYKSEGDLQLCVARTGYPSQLTLCRNAWTLRMADTMVKSIHCKSQREIQSQIQREKSSTYPNQHRLACRYNPVPSIFCHHTPRSIIHTTTHEGPSSTWPWQKFSSPRRTISDKQTIPTIVVAGWPRNDPQT
jgi:hypothetical protein